VERSEQILLKIADRPAQRFKRKSISRSIGLASLLVLVGWAAWEIFSRAAATALSTSDLEAALWWDSAAVLADAADHRLTEARTSHDLEEVKALADRALVASPLAQPALRQLGLVADLEGAPIVASRIMKIAGQASPFDTVSQVWLLNTSLRHQDFKDAVVRIDILFRTRPDLVDRLLPSVIPIIQSDPGRAALVRVLQSDPPWRTPLLETLGRSADPTIAYSVMAALSSKTAISNEEIKPLVDRLVGAGNFQLGYLTWLQLAPVRAGHSLLSNGDFEHLPSGIPFDWVLTPISGAYTEVVPSKNPGRGNDLHVGFAHTRVAYANTAKLMLLKPGAYRFSGQVRVEGLEAQEGVGWRIRCADGTNQTIADSSHFSGTSSWHEFDVEFAVPEDGCSAQWLTLRNLADLAVEQDIGGDIWFSHLAVDHDLDHDLSG
jgi:hypothetical protein